MTFYNLTGVQNSESLVDLFVASNLMSGGWLALVFLVGLGFVTFVSLKNYPTKEAFAASCFLSTIVSSVFFVLGVVGFNVVTFFILFLAVSIIFLFKGE